MYFNEGLLYPSLYSVGVGDIIFGNDTSGSIRDFQMSACQKLLQDLLDDLNPKSITTIHIDSEIKNIQHFEVGDTVKIEAKGGGGTDFRPYFEFINNLDEKPAGAIYLTDLEGTFPSVEPDYPVLWISTTRNKVAPFGTTVFLDLRS